MDNKFSFTKRTLFYIVFSIFASFALWVNVTYYQNPDVSQTINNIPIEFIGEDTLNERDMIVTDVSREELNIRFTGKRNAISKLNSNNLSVTVDLSEIKSSSAGVYQLSYVVNYPGNVNTSNVSVSSSSVGYISISVEKLVTKSVEVRGGYSGDVAEGFQAKAMEFDPGELTVSGPESIVSKASYAWVYLRGDNISESIEVESDFVLMDENDNELKKDNLTFSEDTVHVRLPILMIKEVPLVVNFIESNGVKANDVTYRITPSATVTLSGEREYLEELNQIVLGSINLSSFVSNTTETFAIAIPNEVENISGNVSATVTVEVQGVSSTKLSATDITVKNAPAGFTASIITQSLDITIRGKSEELSAVKAENIRIVADLSEIGSSAGTFAVEAKVYVDGFGEVDAIGTYTISVTLTRN